MSSSRACCASRESEYLHVAAGEIPELASLLIDVSRPGETFSTYRCRVCGQLWHAYRTASAEGEDFAVVKVGDTAAPARPAVPARPAATAPRSPAPPPEASKRTGGPLGGFGALLLSAAAFYALWALPGLNEGKAAPFGWIARWVAGAILIVLAVQTVVTWLASRKTVRRG
jgi:hypothetical protein